MIFLIILVSFLISAMLALDNTSRFGTIIDQGTDKLSFGLFILAGLLAFMVLVGVVSPF